MWNSSGGSGVWSRRTMRICRSPSLGLAAALERLSVRADHVAGELPAGCDRHLLLAIVHDWDDESAARILATVRNALPPHGRIVVVENVLPDRPRDEFVLASDLLMLALASGRERTSAQFEALFAASGLVIDQRSLLATGSTTFAFAPVDR